ncbi:MAG: molybdopterin-dependent oxidoreductase [Pseudomonadota bacterium]|nr:molybdopterin-dependent oxidoreductase [Pseudomonadota bacterium]
MSDWQPSACMLCENNCGIEIMLADDGRTIEKIRGDEAHPASRGYLCQKASRIDFYQNGADRVTRPLRRKANGSFEAIDWDTAINEIAEKLCSVRDTYGGEKIFYYGGGGQGNHMPGAYGLSTVAALGGKYRSNALAQEKTGEGWVAASMFGAYARTGDFENCEVAVFIGKNPWHSHGIPRARVALRTIARDPKRTLVVFDPRLSETADIADVHVRVKPGTDAWALAALVAVIVEEGLSKSAWLEAHVDGMDEVLPIIRAVPIAAYCAHAGVSEAQIRDLARRLAAAESVAWYEDLGVQMNRHSTLVSYLHRLAWLVTGSFGKKGSQFIPNVMRPLMSGNPSFERRSPVAGAPLLGGMVPCNVIAGEILSDHPGRYRAMLIETANPAHSLADSPKFVRAMEELELSVVIDVAMTETARHADYVLPVATQYEKAEATFFNFEYPKNYFHLRHPIMAPPDDADVLIEAEIHARLVEAIGAMPPEVPALEQALENGGRLAFAKAFLDASLANPGLQKIAPVVLYRVLGPTLPEGCGQAAALWGVAHFVAQREPEALKRAGIAGEGPVLGENLFDTILSSPRGFVFSIADPAPWWRRVRTPHGRIHADIPELLPVFRSLEQGPESITNGDYPFVLSAGERRAYTANTILRGKAWRKKDPDGALRICPQDAERLSLADGDRAKLNTRSGEAEVVVEISERMQPGHVSLPNGFGIDAGIAIGGPTRTGAATNELTSSDHRDFFAGTPWHKLIAANITST